MIRSIKIESFLLLKAQYIEFSEGLNVITGESGAGKSMLMDAIKYALGLKNISDENASVEIEIDEDIIRRETKSGKSRFYINGMGSNQKTILEHWGKDILFQEQSSQSKIFKKHHQLEILDKDKDIAKILKDFAESFDAFRQKEEHLKELLLEKESITKQIEQNQELIKDLENLNINIETYEDIKNQSQELYQKDKINSYIQNVLNALEYGETSALSKINYSISQINQAIHLNQDLEKATIKLNELKDNLLETISFIASYKAYVDIHLLDKLNETIFNVQSLERKYRKSFEDIYNISKLQKDYINTLEDLNLKIENTFKELNNLKENTLQKAKDLSNLRKQKAKELSNMINDVLGLLNLKEAHFEIEIKPKELSKTGIDDIAFLFSSYSKNHLKELFEVASGGEASRITLAISSVFKDYKTYIYDEIDTGTSGEASISIAMLLKNISKSSQVICISHTPALAAASDSHIFIKRQSNNVFIKSLDTKEKLEEVSRLMGIISNETKEGAKKLIEKFSL